MDTAHDLIATRVEASARWFDTFFDDPNFVEEDVSTRLRVRTDAFFSQRDEEKFSANVNLKLHLPALSHALKSKVSLLVGGDETLDDPDVAGTNSIDNALNDATDDPTVGLQYFLFANRDLNVNMTAGVRLSGPALFVGPRASYVHTLSEVMLLRFIERIRWYTDDGWESRTRLDLDRSFGSSRFFRQTFEIRWRESSRDEDGFRFQALTNLTQRLSSRQAVSYRWNNTLKTEPDIHMDSTVLLVQYRRRIFRKWLFCELIPQLAFQDEYDWKANPGVTLRLEVVFGG